MDIKEFKEKLGKPLAEIDLQDVKAITEDQDMLMALNDLEMGLEISEEVMRANQDSEVRSEFAPLMYHHQFYGSQKELGQLFAQYETDKDATRLRGNLDGFFKGATPLGKLNGYLLALSAMDGYEVEYDDVREAVKATEDILFELDFEKAFPIICDIMDSLYTIQEEYYKKYKLDIIAEDTAKMNDFVKRLNDFTQSIYDEMEKHIDEELPDDIKPEDIGALDMTKFKEDPTEKEV